MVIEPKKSLPGGGNFTLITEDCLGRGRLGPVFALRPNAGQASRVLKVLPAAFADSGRASRFSDELRRAASIRDKNVLGYTRYHEGLRPESKLPPHVIVYRADGCTLESMLTRANQRGAPPPLAPPYDIICQLLSGMEAIQNKLVLHRNLTPANVFLSGGLWKISDYGLSIPAGEATRHRLFCGSGALPYIAPEAWDEEEATFAMDVYSLGMVFYHLVTRRLPLEVSSNDPLTWREAHLHQPVLPPHQVNAALPPRLSQMILQMTAKDPTSRPRDWQTVWELLSDDAADSSLNQLIHDTRRNRLEMDPDEVASAPQREAEQERQHAIAAANAPRLALEAERKRQTARQEADPFVAQAMQTVIRPLQDWAEASNRGSSGGQTIQTDLHQEGATVVYSMLFPDGTTRQINFEVLLADDHRERINSNPFDPIYDAVFPRLQEKSVRMFGSAALQDGRGLNLILVQEENASRGEWLVQINHVNPSAIGSRFWAGGDFMVYAERQLQPVVKMAPTTTRPPPARLSHCLDEPGGQIPCRDPRFRALLSAAIF